MQAVDSEEISVSTARQEAVSGRHEVGIRSRRAVNWAGAACQAWPRADSGQYGELGTA